MRLIEVKYFKLINTIAEEGTLAKAADKLFLTQSALSHQLRELETQLGTKVFNRVNKNLVLTEVGQLILDSSSTILTEAQEVNDKISKHLKGESGTIRIGAESSTCYHWLPKLIKEHQAEFPNVEFRLQPNGVNSPLNLLMEGQLDLAIVYRKSDNKHLVYQELLMDDVVALLPADHPFIHKEFLTPNDFEELTYITHSEQLDKSIFFEEFLQPEQVSPKKVMYIQSTATVLEMVNEGLGVSVMAKWLVEPYLNQMNIKMVKLGAKGLKRTWHLATLKSESISPPLSRFIEIIQADLISHS